MGLWAYYSTYHRKDGADKRTKTMAQLSVSVQVNGTTYNYAADNLTVARSIVEDTIKLAQGAQVRANVWAYVDGTSVLLPNNVTELNVWNLELTNA
jgi:hypothetical protein